MKDVRTNFAMSKLSNEKRKPCQLEYENNGETSQKPVVLKQSFKTKDRYRVLLVWVTLLSVIVFAQTRVLGVMTRSFHKRIFHTCSSLARKLLCERSIAVEPKISSSPLKRS
jgi:hypothetical protein